jgi:hypothetical protein
MSKTHSLKRNLLLSQRPSIEWGNRLKDYKIIAEETPRPEKKE